MTAFVHCGACGTKLVPAALPGHAPTCPACGWFRPTSAMPVALVIARSPSGRIVYTRQPGWPAGAWGLVAGFIEEGETAEQCALREVLEETGLVARRPRILRTMAARDLVLVCIVVDIEECEPVAASDVEAVKLVAPDLLLTPEGWSARELVQHYLSSPLAGEVG